MQNRRRKRSYLRIMYDHSKTIDNIEVVSHDDIF